MAKAFVPQSTQMVCDGLCYSGPQPSSEIMQRYHKPAIIHNEHYSLSMVSEKEYHVEDQPQMETAEV